MKLKQHALLYITLATVFLAARWYLIGLRWQFALALYLGFFLINPDYDKILGIAHHRNWITHSIMYPIGIYWGLHDYWNMLTADELGIVLMFPLLVHLLGDYKIKHLMDAADGVQNVRTTRFRKRKQLVGSWLISIPFGRLSLGATGWYISMNLLLGSAYIVLVLLGKWDMVLGWVI